MRLMESACAVAPDFVHDYIAEGHQEFGFHLVSPLSSFLL
jgi:hypothetical protein